MPKKLLLADDSVTIQRVIELTFSGEDVQVLAVSDGEEAIARIPAEKPDIILADIGMPKRSGYEVSAFVKGRPELAHIPVLLLAGAFEPVDEAKAKEAGCDGVLVKPFEPQHVIARVRELLGGATGSPTQSAVSDILRPAAALAPSRPVELPTRDDKPPVPEDLMDFSDESFLPREDDLLPQIEDVETPAQPIATDNSLDDYFDKLDEAFSTISNASPAGASVPHSDGPVLERDLESFDAPRHLEPPRVEAADPFAGFDAIHSDTAAAVPTLDDLLAGMPPPPEPAPITFEPMPALVIDIPSPPPAAVPSPIAIASPTIEPPDVTPTLAAAPPAPAAVSAPPEAPAGRSIIADAFSALFAAEQGEPGAVPVRLGGNGSAPVITDAVIDDVARRVIQRLALGSSDQMQTVVKEIVSSVAERLVREEIDRIRRNAPRS
jgi:CheY-like chemotaxis protein